VSETPAARKKEARALTFSNRLPSSLFASPSPPRPSLAAMFGSSVPNGSLTNFSGTIIKDMGFSTFDAALLDCAGRSFQIISLIIAGLVANYVKNTRMAMVNSPLSSS